MQDSLRKKLWNRADWPVWSLSTIDKDGVPNMNICTYVVPVSMDPKGFVVALYENTKTLSNVQDSMKGYLQLLSQDQKRLVKKFGTKSGNEKAKLDRFRGGLIYKDNYAILEECLGYAELEFDYVHEGGDHVIGYARVVSSKNLNLGEVMTTHFLKDEKIIR